MAKNLSSLVAVLLSIALLLSGVVIPAPATVSAAPLPQKIVEGGPAPAGSEPGVVQAEEHVESAATAEDWTITYRWNPESCGGWCQWQC